MAPRNFAERHLVDEMAIAKWRTMRTVLMERAVYDCHAASPRSTPCADPSRFNQHVFHVASAHRRQNPFANTFPVQPSPGPDAPRETETKTETTKEDATCSPSH